MMQFRSDEIKDQNLTQQKMSKQKKRFKPKDSNPLKVQGWFLAWAHENLISRGWTT